MSKQLVSHSPDLQQLRKEGYDFEVRANQLVVKNVPYVNASRSVQRGILVSELSTQGNRTVSPGTHEIWWVGSLPCDQNGAELSKMINQRGSFPLGGDLTASCSFSSKPPAGYPNYYEKIAAYVGMLEGHAKSIDSKATARTFALVATEERESVFRYLDSATSRARTGAVSEKLALAKVVIVGLGGTGSYIVDLVSKTEVREVHLYDGDIFQTHNAYRAPGAASIEELEAAPLKVDYFKVRYDPMHRHIIAHDADVDESNVEELRDASFVFLAVEGGPTKKFIIEALERFHVPFIDVGMGVYQVGTSLGGMVRITTSIENHRRHVWDKQRINFADEPDDDYDQNIQIAELNMLNATLAVIKWKKLFGFYTDYEKELSSTYTIDGNHLLNEDQSQ